MSRAPWIGVAVVALGVAGCTTSFDVAPGEVPRLGHQQVVDLSGDWVTVPAKWKGTVVPKDGDGRRLMTSPGADYARALPVPRQQIDAAEDDGWSDEPIRLQSSFEAGIGPPGAGALPPLARTETQSRRATGAGGEVLWVRDEGGRIVELPIAWVDYVHVEEEDTGSGGGKAVWITLVAVGGAAVLTGAIVLLAVVANGMGQMD
jgi:hypothetical protein